MKISKLNESVMKVVNKYNVLRESFDDDDDDRLVLTIYYLDADNNRKDLKSSKRVKFIRDEVRGLVSDPEKLNSMGATGLFVDDERGRDIFSAVQEEDGSWTIDEDNFDEYSQTYLMPDDYKDIMFNRVLYTLTSPLPPNLKYNNPSLYDNIYKIKPGLKITSDLWSYDFLDNGDVVFRITLEPIQVKKEGNWEKRNEKILSEKENMLKDVCDHYGLELKSLGNRKFSILVPDQVRLFTDETYV